MAEILLATLGSGGDVFPFVALAGALSSRGHRVALAASPDMRLAALAAGVPFIRLGTALGPRHDRWIRESLSSTRGDMIDGFSEVVREHLLPDTARHVEILAPHAATAALVVCHPLQYAGQFAAERVGARLVTLSMFPQFVQSADYGPPSNPGVKGIDISAAWADFFRRLAPLDREVNAIRRLLGLGEIDRATNNGHRVELVMMAVDARYLAPTDWPQSLRLIGFNYWDSPRRHMVSNALRTFLADGEGPVIVSLGTTFAREGGAIYSAATEAATRRGFRVILLGAPAPLASALASSTVFAADYAPLSVLARGCRLMVHHAGIGTIAATLRAGVPSLCVPHSYDQPWNAHRIAHLGLGRTVPWHEASTDAIDGAMEDVSNDSGIASRARAFETALSLTPAASETGADVLEDLLR